MSFLSFSSINIFALVLFITMASQAYCEGNSLLSDAELKPIKRSLCNTFGGCGSFYDGSDLKKPNWRVEREYTKRSTTACKAFGLCNPKRSVQNGRALLSGTNNEIQREPQLDTLDEFIPTPEQRELIEFKANLIREALSDLLAYLKAIGEHELDRYIVMLPKQYNGGDNVGVLGNIVNIPERKFKY